MEKMALNELAKTLSRPTQMVYEMAKEANALETINTPGESNIYVRIKPFEDFLDETMKWDIAAINGMLDELREMEV